METDLYCGTYLILLVVLSVCMGILIPEDVRSSQRDGDEDESVR